VNLLLILYEDVKYVSLIHKLLVNIPDFSCPFEILTGQNMFKTREILGGGVSLKTNFQV